MNLKVRILIINNLRKGRFKGAMRELVRGSLIMAERGWPSRSRPECRIGDEWFVKQKNGARPAVKLVSVRGIQSSLNWGRD